MKRTFDNFNAVDSGFNQDKVINDEYFNAGGLLGQVSGAIGGAIQSGVDTLGNVYETWADTLQGQTTGMNSGGCVKPIGYALDFKKIRQSSRNYDACLAAANVVDPDTQAFQNLVAQLPEKYQTALESDNLSYDLNDAQKQKLIDDITAIAKDVSLSGAGKLSKAINVVEAALPYLKQSATMGGSMASSPNQTRSTGSDQELADARKKAWIGLGIVGGVAVIGYVTYLVIKNRK
jgi:hypothetical protein